jgi:hypothetical protein
MLLEPAGLAQLATRVVSKLQSRYFASATTESRGPAVAEA